MKRKFPICQRVSCGKKNDGIYSHSMYCNKCILFFEQQARRINGDTTRITRNKKTYSILDQ